MRFAVLKVRRFQILIVVILSLFTSCGNEESWTYKAWHNTLAHYNIFFNGEQKWLETHQTVRESYKEDFRKPIELFNYGSLTGLQANLAAMDEVIKKASTMIDKHPKSKWVDDAYLLTGKAYLFKGDATAAINIFEYVYSQYSDPVIRFKAKLWTVKALLLQNKIVDAEAMAQFVIKNPELPKRMLFEAQLTLGAIYHKQKKFQQSAELLSKALPNIKNRMDKYRVYFALGQSYQQLEDFEKAERAYSKVPKFNPPYEITFNSQIEQVSILSAKQQNYERANKILERMLRDDKNIDYRGKIYFRMALNQLNANDREKAVATLRKSVVESQSDNNQKTTSYLKLGDIHYANRQFEWAGKYYDSAFRVLDETHPNFESILKRNEILSELLGHLVTIKQNDSLIRMANDEPFRDRVIKAQKKAEKESAERIKKALANQQYNNNSSNLPFGAGNMPGNTNMPSMPAMGGGVGGSTFPFYNVITRKNGKNEFKRKWGNRSNSDYWKYASKMQSNQALNNNNPNSPGTNSDPKDSISNTSDPQITDNSNQEFLKDVPKEDQKYYRGIPFKKKKQLEMLKEVEIALFESANIYKERLAEYPTAVSQFEQLVSRFDTSKYLPQAFYELVKLNRLVGRPTLAKLHQDTLKRKFPESIYVKMLENPEALKNIRKSQIAGSQIIQKKFDSMSMAFQQGDYKSAKKIKLATDYSYSGNALQPRFDYLYALCMLKTDSAKAIPYLEQLPLDYPNTDASEKAKDLIRLLTERNTMSNVSSDTLLQQSASFTIYDETIPLQVAIIIPKSANKNMVKAMISDLNKKDFSFDKLVMGRTLALNEEYLLIVENFPDNDKALFYMRYLRKQQSLFNSRGVSNYSVVAIQPANLQSILIKQEAGEYIDWYQKQYP